MKIGSSGFIGILVFMSISIFSGSVMDAAADRIRQIEESELDAKIGNQKNHLVMVFMAAWCAPCIDELPTLNKLHQKFKNQGLDIFGISIDLDGPQAMQPIVDQHKVNFPVYWYGEKAVEKFALFAIPMLLLAKDGEIVERIHGRRPESFLTEKFTNFLK
jgi:thiol-disulfide isomerase/thioredoxin